MILQRVGESTGPGVEIGGSAPAALGALFPGVVGYWSSRATPKLLSCSE